MDAGNVKSHVTKAACIGLGWVSGRYHLSGDQVLAIAGDAGSVAAFAYGVFAAWGMKKVPQTAIAIEPSSMSTVQSLGGDQVKVVGTVISPAKVAAMIALFFALSWMFLLSPAIAADIPAKPKQVNALFTGYPYASSGFYFGLNTVAGGGSVQASGVGVNPNSVAEIQGSIGGTVGYVWATPNVFYAVEAMFNIQNLNGNAAGFSLTGPAAFEQRIKIGTPLANFLNLFPTLGLPTVPPFPVLPGGAVATNVHPYLMASLHEDDISVNFGLANNRAWSVSPGIGVGAMGQLANGIAVDVWAETQFKSQSVCAGLPGGNVCGNTGQKFLIGFGVYY